MLSYLQVLIDELSLFLQDFSQRNHLPVCYLKNCQQLFLNVNANKSVSSLIINCELKSTEKQPFDIRLSFNSVQLKEWWQLLQPLSRQIEGFNWKHCKVSSATVVDKIHVVDIGLCRKSTIDNLLTALCSEPEPTRSSHTAVVIKIDRQQNDTYMAQTRIALVCNVVENLLNHFGASTFDSKTFHDFVAQNSDVQIDWQQLIDKYHCQLSADERISAIDPSNKNLKKILHYLSLLNGYLSHLKLFESSNASSVVIIIVVAESEFTRAQIAVDLLRVLLSAKQSQLTFFKFIKVSGVFFEEQNQVNSFLTYKELLQQNSIINDISPDNLDTIVQTMQAFLLLTPRLNSSICKLVHFRNESIFVQYNIARIKSILTKYRTEYLTQSEDALSFSQLATDHEWNLTVVYLLRMQQLNLWLYTQLTDDTVVHCDFDCNKMVDLIKKIAHSFSCYYRNVKILAEPVEHLLPTIASRVKFCDIILKQMCFYFSLLNIATAERM